MKKLSPDGSYRYSTPLRDDNDERDSRLRKIFGSASLALIPRRNLVIITRCPALPTRRLRAGQHGYSIPGGHPRWGRHGIPRHAESIDAVEFCRKSRQCCNVKKSPH